MRLHNKYLYYIKKYIIFLSFYLLNTFIFVFQFRRTLLIIYKITNFLL